MLHAALLESEAVRLIHVPVAWLSQKFQACDIGVHWKRTTKV